MQEVHLLEWHARVRATIWVVITNRDTAAQVGEEADWFIQFRPIPDRPRQNVQCWREDDLFTYHALKE